MTTASIGLNGGKKQRIIIIYQATMKFIISKTALEMAVKNICRVINPKNALPILADILCMVDV